MADLAVPQVANDHPCRSCGYNLRGLTFAHRCPECGEPVCHSVRLILRASDKAGRGTSYGELLKEQFRAIAQATGFPVMAVSFVFTATRYARRRVPQNVDLSAREICAALRDYAKFHFGGEAPATMELAARRIGASEDIGKIVFAMVDAGLFKTSPGDSPGDFAGLFKLENIFSADF